MLFNIYQPGAPMNHGAALQAAAAANQLAVVQLPPRNYGFQPQIVPAVPYRDAPVAQEHVFGQEYAQQQLVSAVFKNYITIGLTAVGTKIRDAIAYFVPSWRE